MTLYDNSQYYIICYFMLHYITLYRGPRRGRDDRDAPDGAGLVELQGDLVVIIMIIIIIIALRVVANIMKSCCYYY